MRIWRIIDPLDHGFATCSRIGTWEQRAGGSVRVSPLVIEWEKGATAVGDFMWPFVSEFVVREHVFRALREEFSGIEACPVQIVPLRRKPKRMREDGHLHMWSDHVDLVDVCILTSVDADPSRSTRERITRQDGSPSDEFTGIEHVEYYSVPGALLPKQRRVPRMQNAGVFVRASSLNGQSLFKVNQCPAWNFCTDRVHDFILDRGYTNVDFFEMGELF